MTRPPAWLLAELSGSGWVGPGSQEDHPLSADLEDDDPYPDPVLWCRACHGGAPRPSTKGGDDL